eukprot:945232-Ditylum_brightwellii.AAC.1
MNSSLSFRRKGRYRKYGVDNEKDVNEECNVDEGFSLPVDECNEGNKANDDDDHNESNNVCSLVVEEAAYQMDIGSDE